MTESVTPRLKAQYEETIRGKLQEEFGYTNVMQAPRIEKVVVATGVGKIEDKAKLELILKMRVQKKRLFSTKNC